MKNLQIMNKDELYTNLKNNFNYDVLVINEPLCYITKMFLNEDICISFYNYKREYKLSSKETKIKPLLVLMKENEEGKVEDFCCLELRIKTIEELEYFIRFLSIWRFI